MRKISMSAMLLFAALGAFSQDEQVKDYTKPGTLAIHFGFLDFKTPPRIQTSSLGTVLSNKRWTKLKQQNPLMGISYIKGLSNHFDYSLNYLLSSVDYPFRDATPRYGTDYLLHEVDLSIRMKLLSDKHFLSPYLSAGIGGSAYRVSRFDAFIPLGVGLQFKLAPNTFMFSNFQYRVPVTERGAYHFMSNIGFGFNVEKKKEVVKVAPPPPPPPPPADTDGDGIIDPNDKCPTVKGVAKYQGCPVPDSDKDGVNDDEDKCPNTPGLARYQGCPIPDKDADGINDEEDKCVDVPGFARYQGCPIPDRDGDGVNDEEDRCPDVAGVVANYGCPEIKFKPENITFKTGSAVLTSLGVQELKDNVLPAVKQVGSNPILIEGHTDNTGSDKINLSLSKRRAEAVKAWLVKNGIPADQLSTEGFGSSQPVEDNKTAAGRTKNRRVHLKLIK